MASREEIKLYNVVFYEDAHCESKLRNELFLLAKKSLTNKDARVQLKQITLYIELLKNYGLNQSTNITKHLEGKIWELRTGVNRIIFFYYTENTFVLLHMFRKSTNKTPRNELEKARKEVFDFEKRNGGGKL